MVVQSLSGALDGYYGNLVTYTAMRYKQPGRGAFITPNWRYISFCGHGAYIRLQLYGQGSTWFGTTVQIGQASRGGTFELRGPGGAAVPVGWFAIQGRTNATHCSGTLHVPNGHNFDGYNTGDLLWSGTIDY